MIDSLGCVYTQVMVCILCQTSSLPESIESFGNLMMVMTMLTILEHQVQQYCSCFATWIVISGISESEWVRHVCTLKLTKIHMQLCLL